MKENEGVKTKAEPMVNRAAAAGDLDSLRALIAAGGEVEEIHPITGFRPLHSAAEHGRLEVIRYLLEARANIDSLSQPDHPAPFAGCSALIVAAAKGQLEAVDLLITAGADVDINILSEDVSTALSWGARAGDMRIVRRLLDAGAVVEATSLFGPVENAHVELVALLVESGADVNAVNGHGTPLLVKACEKPAKYADIDAQLRIVGQLLDAGAQLEAKDDLGRTALMAAAQAKNTRLALYLLSRGADAKATDLGNMTALHSAATDGDLELAGALLKAGADKAVENTFGETPVGRAKEAKNKQMLALLNSF